MNKPINITTDQLSHRESTRVEKDVKPCKKVKLADKMSPAEVRAIIEKKRQELTNKEPS